MSDTAALALGSLGSDLAFSVSFGIASELLAAASEAGVAEDELVAYVMSVSIILSAAPKTLRSLTDELRERKLLGFSKAEDGDKHESNGFAAFVGLVLDIARRIAVSTSVQLLASNVRSKQPLRSVRIVSLLSGSDVLHFLGIDLLSAATRRQ